MEGLEVILNDKAVLAFLVAPSMVVGLLLIMLSYRIFFKVVNDFGKPFIESQMRQASAFEQIAKQSEATRITLTAIAEQLDRLKKQVEDMSNGKR